MESEATMRTIEAQQFSIDALKLVNRAVPKPRRGEVLVRVRAATLNYRDLVILTENYLPTLGLPYVPASDACGEVVEVGEEVTRFRLVIVSLRRSRRAGMMAARLLSKG